jgi:hypothetical protein
MCPHNAAGQSRTPSFRADIYTGFLGEMKKKYGMQLIVGKRQGEAYHYHCEAVDNPPHWDCIKALSLSRLHKERADIVAHSIYVWRSCRLFMTVS